MLAILIKKIIEVLIVVIPLGTTFTNTYAQSGNEIQKIISKKDSITSFREVSGYITSYNSLLADVNVTVKNTNRGTKSMHDGFYSLKAKKGEILKFTYVGMKHVEIVVEDVTQVLNIEMLPEANNLDEITVKANSGQNKGFTAANKPKFITTARGTIDTRKAGYSITYIKGEDLNTTAVSFSRLRGSIWDVDGVIHKSPPPIDWNNIVDVAIIRSLAGTIIYGSEGRHGVIIVRTKVAAFSSTNNNVKLKSYTNKNYYQNDALVLDELNSFSPYYLNIFDTISSPAEAYKVYQKMIPSHKDLPHFYLDITEYFHNSYENSEHFLEVLVDMENTFSKNVEALKALAYKYQEYGLHKRALNIYKKIILLRPSYAQSFRDLANAYINDGQFKSGWRIYMNYLYRGNELGKEGVGQIIYHEMEALYIQKRDVANIKEKFVTRDDRTNISSDIRLVFEWNTSEAEFELEFVNPQKQSYSFEHTLEKNSELIFDEKMKGYSSEEFMIEDVGTGDWLVNLKYFGNKKYDPTYLKMTIFYHWGKSNEKEEISLFKLTKKNMKVNLLKINAELMASMSN